MYLFTLHLHSYLRWAVLLVGVVALVMAVAGAASRSSWTPQQRRLGLAFTTLMDVQLLIGIVLYLFLSPITRSAFQDMGAAMGDSAVRFFVAEHLVGMIAAVVLAHVGAVRARRKNAPAVAAVFYALAFAVMLVSIPWGRGLLPGA